ncbi:DEAD/DEAH box helicase [Listeria welshimeri]|nr:DEAD/DEAH box helicase [Listeria welshimeri]
MKVEINYGKPSKIYSSCSPNSFFWNQIVGIFLANQSDLIVGKNTITLDWATILISLDEFANFCKKNNISITLDESAKKRILEFKKNKKIVKSANLSPLKNLSDKKIEDFLLKSNLTKRYLYPHQLSVLKKLISLPNGANFSVPGSGKTTVTLALHMLIRDADTKLLIISPKNAFSAWDEVINDCIDDSVQPDWKFTRLTGGKENIEHLLSKGKRTYILSYDQLRTTQNIVYEFLTNNKVHLVLDESHKMKAGHRSQTGKAVLQIAHAPIRKDILTGTPMPNSFEDLEYQFDFLWPGQKILKKQRDGIKHLYARTTKKSLDIPEMKKHFIHVPMSDPQLAFYSIVRSEFLKKATGMPLSSKSYRDFTKIKKSVIQLLQISSNPIILVNNLTQNDPMNFIYEDKKTESLFHQISQEQDSNKIKETCKLARKIVGNHSNQKVVIWSTFTYNIERLAELLRDLGAVFINGTVDTGDIEDDCSREGKIYKFKNDPECKVLIASPASCSEGISLHQVCHNAIYLDRSYNAGQFIQSLDRIHRLGLERTIETNVYLLQTTAPTNLGSIDASVQERTLEKLKAMDRILDDIDIKQLIIDESEQLPDEPVLDSEDIRNLFIELSKQ